MRTRLLSLCIVGGVLAAPASGMPRNPLAPASPAPMVTEPGLHGTLTIRAVQGTQGGPDVGVADVSVEFVHRKQVVHAMTAKLDERGMLVVKELPVGTGARPVVRIKHAGVEYQEVGPALDAAQPDIAMEVTVYETTDTPPEWRVAMRHVMAKPAAEGLAVSEMVVVENPGDRTWLGGPADAQGRRPVVELFLPAGARDVQLNAGFHGWCCTEFAGRALTVQMPLMPGRATYRFSYMVTPADGRADLQFGAKGACDHALVLAPDDGSEIELVGVQAASADEAKGMPGVRVFQASNVERGALFGVSMKRPMSVAAAPTQGEMFSLKRVIALSGGGVVVLIGVLLLVRRAKMHRPSGA